MGHSGATQRRCCTTVIGAIGCAAIRRDVEAPRAARRARGTVYDDGAVAGARQETHFAISTPIGISLPISISISISSSISISISIRMEGGMDGWAAGWMDGWAAGWMDGWMDGGADR